MIVVVEILKGVPGKVKELQQALIEIAPICRKEPGCLQYDILKPIKANNDVLVLMRFKKLSDLKKHESSAPILAFVKKYDQILYSDFEVTEWEELPSE